MGLAVKGRDDDADDDDDNGGSGGSDNDDNNCVGSDVVEDADGKGELAKAVHVDCTTELVLG